MMLSISKQELFERTKPDGEKCVVYKSEVTHIENRISIITLKIPSKNFIKELVFKTVFLTIKFRVLCYIDQLNSSNNSQSHLEYPQTT